MTLIVTGIACLGILLAVLLFWPFEDEAIAGKDLFRLPLERANTKQ